ncbi:MAG: glycosyltransferase [Microgenomates group bacterium]
MQHKRKKVALVYDWIDKWGGVERLLLHLNRLIPGMDVYTTAVDRRHAEWARELTIHPSFMQSLPLFLRRNRAFMLPLYPLAFENLDFGEYDTVISVTSAFAKGIVTKPDTHHICYLLTPPRYLWSHSEEYLSEAMRFVGTPFINHLKRWDKTAAQRPDTYVSISDVVAKRALDAYGVKSDVVYPPFDTNYWDEKKQLSQALPPPIRDKKYYLWVGRMERYKRPDIICDVARRMPDYTFVFVGTGTLEEALKRTATTNCIFTGHLTDEALSAAYTHASALIMPQNEDFGYVSLEAQYHGCPVISYRKGGATETVKDGITGLFFDSQSVSSLMGVLERFEQISYNLRRSTCDQIPDIRAQFGSARFDKQFISYI